MGTSGVPIGSESVTKADIQAFINECMEDAISTTALALAIKLCLRDLSNFNFLKATDTSQSLTASDTYLDCPEDYKDIDEIQLTDAEGDLLDPLIAFSGGYKEYLREMGSSQSNGIPEYYSEYNGKFYIYPPADGTYTVAIAYSKYDSQDEDNIEFGPEFTNAIKFGACFYYAMMKARSSYINVWGPAYAAEKELRRLNMKQQPSITE